MSQLEVDQKEEGGTQVDTKSLSSTLPLTQFDTPSTPQSEAQSKEAGSSPDNSFSSSQQSPSRNVSQKEESAVTVEINEADHPAPRDPTRYVPKCLAKRSSAVRKAPSSYKRVLNATAEDMESDSSFKMEECQFVNGHLVLKPMYAKPYICEGSKGYVWLWPATPSTCGGDQLFEDGKRDPYLGPATEDGLSADTFAAHTRVFLNISQYNVCTATAIVTDDPPLFVKGKYYQKVEIQRWPSDLHYDPDREELDCCYWPVENLIEVHDYRRCKLQFVQKPKRVANAWTVEDFEKKEFYSSAFPYKDKFYLYTGLNPGEQYVLGEQCDPVSGERLVDEGQAIIVRVENLKPKNTDVRLKLRVLDNTLRAKIQFDKQEARRKKLECSGVVDAQSIASSSAKIQLEEFHLAGIKKTGIMSTAKLGDKNFTFPKKGLEHQYGRHKQSLRRSNESVNNDSTTVPDGKPIKQQKKRRKKQPIQTRKHTRSGSKVRKWLGVKTSIAGPQETTVKNTGDEKPGEQTMEIGDENEEKGDEEEMEFEETFDHPEENEDTEVDMETDGKEQESSGESEKPEGKDGEKLEPEEKDKGTPEEKQDGKPEGDETDEKPDGSTVSDAAEKPEEEEEQEETTEGDEQEGRPVEEEKPEEESAEKPASSPVSDTTSETIPSAKKRALLIPVATEHSAKNPTPDGESPQVPAKPEGEKQKPEGDETDEKPDGSTVSDAAEKPEEEEEQEETTEGDEQEGRSVEEEKPEEESAEKPASSPVSDTKSETIPSAKKRAVLIPVATEHSAKNPTPDGESPQVPAKPEGEKQKPEGDETDEKPDGKDNDDDVKETDAESTGKRKATERIVTDIEPFTDLGLANSHMRDLEVQLHEIRAHNRELEKRNLDVVANPNTIVKDLASELNKMSELIGDLICNRDRDTLNTKTISTSAEYLQLLLERVQNKLRHSGEVDQPHTDTKLVGGLLLMIERQMPKAGMDSTGDAGFDEESVYQQFLFSETEHEIRASIVQTHLSRQDRAEMGLRVIRVDRTANRAVVDTTEGEDNKEWPKMYNISVEDFNLPKDDPLVSAAALSVVHGGLDASSFAKFEGSSVTSVPSSDSLVPKELQNTLFDGELGRTPDEQIVVDDQNTASPNPPDQNNEKASGRSSPSVYVPEQQKQEKPISVSEKHMRKTKTPQTQFGKDIYKTWLPGVFSESARKDCYDLCLQANVSGAKSEFRKKITALCKSKPTGRWSDVNRKNKWLGDGVVLHRVLECGQARGKMITTEAELNAIRYVTFKKPHFNWSRMTDKEKVEGLLQMFMKLLDDDDLTDLADEAKVTDFYTGAGPALTLGSIDSARAAVAARVDGVQEETPANSPVPETKPKAIPSAKKRALLIPVPTEPSAKKPKPDGDSPQLPAKLATPLSHIKLATPLSQKSSEQKKAPVAKPKPAPNPKAVATAQAKQEKPKRRSSAKQEKNKAQEVESEVPAKKQRTNTKQTIRKARKPNKETPVGVRNPKSFTGGSTGKCVDSNKIDSFKDLYDKDRSKAITALNSCQAKGITAAPGQLSKLMDTMLTVLLRKNLTKDRDPDIENYAELCQSIHLLRKKLAANVTDLKQAMLLMRQFPWIDLLVEIWIAWRLEHEYPRPSDLVIYENLMGKMGEKKSVGLLSAICTKTHTWGQRIECEQVGKALHIDHGQFDGSAPRAREYFGKKYGLEPMDATDRQGNPCKVWPNLSDMKWMLKNKVKKISKQSDDTGERTIEKRMPWMKMSANVSSGSLFESSRRSKEDQEAEDLNFNEDDFKDLLSDSEDGGAVVREDESGDEV